MINTNLTYRELKAILDMFEDDELDQDVVVFHDVIKQAAKATSVCVLDDVPKAHKGYEHILGHKCFVIKIADADPTHVQRLKKMKYAYFIAPKDEKDEQTET